MWDTIAWLLFFFILIAILVIVVYQLICFADLEFDYINPYDSASRINNVVLPEFIAQGVLCLLYLVTGHWMMFLLAVPYLYYNVRLYTRRQHFVDVTEIFNQLNKEKKQRLFKLGHLIFLLFVTLFWSHFHRRKWDPQKLISKNKWPVLCYHLILLLFVILFSMIYNALEEDEV